MRISNNFRWEISTDRKIWEILGGDKALFVVKQEMKQMEFICPIVGQKLKYLPIMICFQKHDRVHSHDELLSLFYNKLC